MSKSENDRKAMYKYSLLVLIAAIDIFLYYMSFWDEPLVYVGTTTHLALLIYLNEIWAERKTKRTMYFFVYYIQLYFDCFQIYTSQRYRCL